MEMQMQIDVWYGVFLMYVGAFLSVLCFARCILYEKIIVSWKRMLGVKFVSCVKAGSFIYYYHVKNAKGAFYGKS